MIKLHTWCQRFKLDIQSSHTVHRGYNNLFRTASFGVNSQGGKKILKIDTINTLSELKNKTCTVRDRAVFKVYVTVSFKNDLTWSQALI